jgi:hypothetical protein
VSCQQIRHAVDGGVLTITVGREAQPNTVTCELVLLDAFGRADVDSDGGRSWSPVRNTSLERCLATGHLGTLDAVGVST